MRCLVFVNLLLIVISCGSPREQPPVANHFSLSKKIGEPFDLKNIVDSTGQEIDIDFSGYDYTMIDFWFTKCPPCIKEMNEFADALSGKEAKVRVISISVNQPWFWNQERRKAEGNLGFFKEKLRNWQQYVLQTADKPSLRNEMSTDRIKELEERYFVSFYPAYFVVDRKGKIISRPASGVAFLKSVEQ